MLLRERTVADYMTMFALLFCVIAYVFLGKNQPYVAILAIDLAYLFDAFDGIVARRRGVVTRFGAMFDSLSDALVYIVFGSLFVLHFFNLSTVSAIVLVWIMTCCGLIRLAYFTEHGLVNIEGRLYYRGLIVPYHLLVILALFFTQSVFGSVFEWVAVPVLFTSSLLMVSDIRVRKVTNLGVIIGVGILLAIISLWSM